MNLILTAISWKAMVNVSGVMVERMLVCGKWGKLTVTGRRPTPMDPFDTMAYGPLMLLSGTGSKRNIKASMLRSTGSRVLACIRDSLEVSSYSTERLGIKAFLDRVAVGLFFAADHWHVNFSLSV